MLSDLGRDIHTYVRTYIQKSAKKISFFLVFRNQVVMKRGEMQKKIFRFLDRLPYFPFYRTIVLNVKVISFWKFFNFSVMRRRVGVGVLLFIPRTVSKHKIQLLSSKLRAILYLSKYRIANPRPLKNFFKNIIRKVFENFLIFGGWGGCRDNFVHSKNSFKT